MNTWASISAAKAPASWWCIFLKKAIQKVGIDDYLLGHSLEEAQKLATDFRVEDIESRERFVPGFVLHDGTIGELVVSEEDERAFIIVVNGSVRKVFRYETPKVIYLPCDDRLVGEVVHFATTATPYDSQARLFGEIRSFVHRYLELPADFEEICFPLCASDLGL